MPRVTGSLVIARPAEAVFDYVADERNEPAYNASMVSVEKLTDGPIRQGTRWGAVLVSRGRRTPMTIEVTHFDRPTRLGSRTLLHSMLIDGDLTLVEDQGRTTLRWDWDLRPRGPLRLLGPLVTRMGRAQEERIWAGLKQLLEER